MIPLGLLPYYFAVEPSPSARRTAFAIASAVVDGSGVGVSIVLEDERWCTEVFRFSRVGLVKMAWSACGQLLAFAQHSTVIVFNAAGKLQLGSLPDNVQYVGFDRHQQLWCLAGKHLQVRHGNRVLTTIDRVDAVAVAEVAAFCRREDTGLCIYVHDTDGSRQLACLPSDAVTMRLSLKGNYLAAAFASPTVQDRGRVRIVRFDLRTSEMVVLMDQLVAIGFNAGPGITAAMLNTGEVLAAYEDGACTRVWTLAPSAPAYPTSPDEFEVFDFVADADGERLAIIASDTRSASGASERQLLVGAREGGDWQIGPPRCGVYEMPRWRADGRLEVLCGTDGRWTRDVADDEPANVARRSNWCTSRAVSRRDTDYDIVTLTGTAHRRAGIILLPRIHQQFIAGAQSFFFHQFLFALARGLADDGYTVAALNGPGAIGRGRARREPSGRRGSYFAQLRTAIHDLAHSLQAEGCRSIGILAGSLAAVPALRCIGPGTPLSASAFVAPLFESSIPVTMPLQPYLVDDPLIQTLEAAAAAVEVPLLIVHGALDEVVPLDQIRRLCSGLRPGAPVETHIFEDEGHIFKETVSWQQTRTAVQDFFATHLAAGSG